MAKVTPVTDTFWEEKYPALRVLVIILYISAAISGFAGLLYLLANTRELNTAILIPIAVCAGVAVYFFAMAQIIKLFIDMERNQRETNELLEQVIKHLPEE
jgi:hypothetical protein